MKVIGVRFRRTGRVYYFDPLQFDIVPGCNVIVETARGIEFGTVITGIKDIPESMIPQPLKPVIRLATEEDVKTQEANAAKEKEAFKICLEKIAKHNLEMKLIECEYTFDNNKLLYYFTADGRVDFRELVKDLAAVFKTRIELRQIGVRDETKILGGIGICGRPLCCHSYLSDFIPVSIKMAKEQNLSLNPTKISGQCGRLMCCLKYEEDTYEETLKKLPQVGKEIVTPDGIGMVTGISVIKEKVSVRIHSGDDFEIRDYAVEDVRKLTNEERNKRNQERAAEPPKPAKEEQKEGKGEEAKDEKKEQKPRFNRAKKNKLGSTDEFFAKNDNKPAEEANAEASQPDEAKED